MPLLDSNTSHQIMDTNPDEEFSPNSYLLRACSGPQQASGSGPPNHHSQSTLRPPLPPPHNHTLSHHHSSANSLNRNSLTNRRSQIHAPAPAPNDLATTPESVQLQDSWVLNSNVPLETRHFLFKTSSGSTPLFSSSSPGYPLTSGTVYTPPPRLLPRNTFSRKAFKLKKPSKYCSWKCAALSAIAAALLLAILLAYFIAMHLLGLNWQLQPADGHTFNNGIRTGLPGNDDGATLPSGGKGEVPAAACPRGHRKIQSPHQLVQVFNPNLGSCVWLESLGAGTVPAPSNVHTYAIYSDWHGLELLESSPRPGQEQQQQQQLEQQQQQEEVPPNQKAGTSRPHVPLD
ncbi:Teneurin-2 [Sciurus carolinensis]|uniref:Teneurin-2 n=1 Tax=Sciurus carolinensis TaxID=30640 RepID=A0AA41MVS2_SCICA|nr:Teneurin-2 [Sciurus carolinensis]